MAFSFGFSGDDIEEDPNDILEQQQHVQQNTNVPPPIPAKSHDLDDFLSTIPNKLSYSTLTITSPHGSPTRLPRRDLFDIRLQLMAEDADPNTSDPLTGLSTTDLTPNIYEGGYKTWECSLDLASYLLSRGPRKSLDDLVRVDHVIEMGCGSAVPSMVLFEYCVREKLGMGITLMDYNEEVLRLVTVPNLVLCWLNTLTHEQSSLLFEGQGHGDVGAQNPLLDKEKTDGDVFIEPVVIDAFKKAMKEIGITITLISGSWTPTDRLLDLVPSAPGLNTFILGSETIYSPKSLEAFTEAIVALMGRVKTGKAVVAAKRVYFGVGGSVDGFREECSRRGAVAYEVEFEGLESDGVRRCLLEVQMY